MSEPTHDLTPDGTYIFEVQRDDGTRLVATVFPEDVDEIAGPASEQMDAEEKQRRFRVARLLAESDLSQQGSARGGGDGRAGREERAR
jgi:hypothetical protein